MAILVVAVDIGNNLRNPERHLLKSAEPEPFALGTGNTCITAVVQHIDVFVAVAGILGGNQETIAKHIDGAAMYLDFPRIDLKEWETTLITLVRHNQHENVLGWETDNELDE